MVFANVRATAGAMALVAMSGLFSAAAASKGPAEWMATAEGMVETMVGAAGEMVAPLVWKAAGQNLQYDENWLNSLPKATGDEDWQCLTQALYFEARGETVTGQFAVAEVILNRRDSALYPRTVCGVVHQGGRGSCQFSYACDGRVKMREKDAALQAGRIARLMLDGAARPLTDGATHFHTKRVRPDWSKRFPQTAQIGAHLFYRQPGA